MIEIVPKTDALLGRACLSYQLQFRLPDAARDALAEISSELAKEIPGLWLAPQQSLHVTCASLISPRDDWYDKDQYWDRISSLATACVRQVELFVPAFRLHFGVLRVTDRAIVVLADQEPCVACARAIVSRLIPAPGTRSLPQPETIHASICRYSEPTSIPRLSRLAAGRSLDLYADIDTLVLVRETIYPSLQNETLMSASLARSIGAAGA